MDRFPDDIFTEPADVDPDTLANLGPLRRLAGIWQGDKGVDLNPKAEGPERRVYAERIELQPIDPQLNGPQLIYGLRYHVDVLAPGEDATFHDQIGYWLYEPATGLVMQTVAIPRGQVALASGHAQPDSRTLSLKAVRGSTEFGIASAPFLEWAFRTDSYAIEVTFNDDGSWSYVSDTMLAVRGRPEPFRHRDANDPVQAPPAAMPADPVFQVRGLTKTYRTAAGEVRALQGVDLDIDHGELLVLLGPSGSGKSTLLNVLGGLDRASAGQALFHGRGETRDLAAASEAELTRYRRRSVGFIFQFFNLSPSLTARENVELITEIAEDPMPADEALARVGLSARMDHFPAELSGGEQQRVAVARAIAKRPEILFCDEPTGSLDSASGVKVLEAITAVAGEAGATTMIVTHNAVVADLADRVIRFSDGRVAGIEANPAKRAARDLAW